jgi:hypothetical protein
MRYAGYNIDGGGNLAQIALRAHVSAAPLKRFPCRSTPTSAAHLKPRCRRRSFLGRHPSQLQLLRDAFGDEKAEFRQLFVAEPCEQGAGIDHQWLENLLSFGRRHYIKKAL